VFELKAIGERNQLKAYTIAENFKQSERKSMVVTTSLVFFLYNYSNTTDLKTETEKCRSSYWVNPYFLKEYDVALKKLSHEKGKSDSGFFAGYRCKSKGVGQVPCQIPTCYEKCFIIYLING
jgi:DNA polymerase-3 subunit delta